MAEDTIHQPDYDDATSSATSIPSDCAATYVDACDLQAVEQDMHGWVPTAQVWVTESGVRLDNPATHDHWELLGQVGHSGVSTTEVF